MATTSIFPSVTVTQIRALQANNKPLPNMPVGLIGPRFKRLTEEKLNGYYINPDTAPSVAVQLTGPSDGDYIDYDSVKASLRLASTGEVLPLKAADEDIVGVRSLVQSGIELTNYGFYQAISSGADWVLLPQKGSKATYGALLGDYLYKADSTADVFNKIKQVTPVLQSSRTFAVTDGVGALADGVFIVNEDITVDNTYRYNWLVAIDKNDPKSLFQFQITASSASGNSVTVRGYTSNAGVPDTLDLLSHSGNNIDVTAYNWFIYDIPIGGLRTYAHTGGLNTQVGTYSIYNYNLRIGTEGTIGYMKPSSDRYFFQPDTKALTTYFGVLEGHVLRSTLRSNNDVVYDFRIKTVGSKRLLSINAPSGYSTGVYTIDGVDYTSSIATTNFLVAISKTNPYISKSFELTSVDLDDPDTLLTISTSLWDGGSPISSSFTDYDWYIYEGPVGSLEIEGGANFTTVSSAAANYDFSIVDTADFYVSGRNEVTILNYLSDAEGNPVGLADVLLDYRVLVTQDADQIYDITSNELRTAICGETSLNGINPLGLAALLVEANSIFAYKVIPTNIAFSERDPDAPLSYSGRYVKGSANYHDVNKLDWTAAKNVLVSIKDTQIPYYIIPLSKDDSVTGMFATAMTSLSEPDKMKEMVTFIGTSLPTRESVLSNINASSGDFSVVSGRLRYHPSTKYVSAEEPNVAIDFLGIGAKKGDYVVYTEKVTEEEKTVKIMNIYPTYFDLGEVSNFVNDVEGTLSISKIYTNKDDIATAIAKKGESYASYRVKLLWGDYVDVTLGGDTYVSVPMYYGAAAYSAMANNIGTVLPKTNRTIVGISKVYNVAPYFSVDQLEIIGAGLVDILTQDYVGGPVYSKRQFMTDGSELSGVEPVDKLAKYVRSIFRPYLGKYNITGQLFDVMGLILAGVVDVFVPSELTSLVVTSPLTVTGAKKDRLSLKLKPTTYKPFNGLDVTVEVA